MKQQFHSSARSSVTTTFHCSVPICLTEYTYRVVCTSRISQQYENLTTRLMAGWQAGRQAVCTVDYPNSNLLGSVGLTGHCSTTTPLVCSLAVLEKQATAVPVHLHSWNAHTHTHCLQAPSPWLLLPVFVSCSYRLHSDYRMQQDAEQQLLPPPLLFCRWSCELGSGRFSRGTRCMTVVLPNGKPRAPSVTLLCKKRPW